MAQILVCRVVAISKKDIFDLVLSGSGVGSVEDVHVVDCLKRFVRRTSRKRSSYCRKRGCYVRIFAYVSGPVGVVFSVVGKFYSDIHCHRLVGAWRILEYVSSLAHECHIVSLEGLVGLVKGGKILLVVRAVVRNDNGRVGLVESREFAFGKGYWVAVLPVGNNLHFINGMGVRYCTGHFNYTSIRCSWSSLQRCRIGKQKHRWSVVNVKRAGSWC